MMDMILMNKDGSNSLN